MKDRIIKKFIIEILRDKIAIEILRDKLLSVLINSLILIIVGFIILVISFGLISGLSQKHSFYLGGEDDSGMDLSCSIASFSQSEPADWIPVTGDSITIQAHVKYLKINKKEIPIKDSEDVFIVMDVRANANKDGYGSSQIDFGNNLNTEYEPSYWGYDISAFSSEYPFYAHGMDLSDSYKYSQINYDLRPGSLQSAFYGDFFNIMDAKKPYSVEITHNTDKSTTNGEENYSMSFPSGLQVEGTVYVGDFGTVGSFAGPFEKDGIESVINKATEQYPFNDPIDPIETISLYPDTGIYTVNPGECVIDLKTTGEIISSTPQGGLEDTRISSAGAVELHSFKGVVDRYLATQSEEIQVIRKPVVLKAKPPHMINVDVNINSNPIVQMEGTFDGIKIDGNDVLGFKTWVVNNYSTILIGLFLSLIGAGFLTSVDKRRKGKRNVWPEAWICACGAQNAGNFCMQCGTHRPSVGCEKCGWQSSDGNLPKFCPNCGNHLHD